VDEAGMAGAVARIYSGDRDKPKQQRITAEGNVYLAAEFPRLSFIKAVSPKVDLFNE
jgi:hypothetical protein